MTSRIVDVFDDEALARAYAQTLPGAILEGPFVRVTINDATGHPPMMVKQWRKKTDPYWTVTRST